MVDRKRKIPTASASTTAYKRRARRSAAAAKVSNRKIIALALGAITALVVLMACFLDYYGHVDRAEDAQAIVVMGEPLTAHGQPGDSLRAATLLAVALYREGLARRIICTGGVHDHLPSEARAAADLAIAEGIPARNLILEDQSGRTMEKVRNTVEICRLRGWRRVIVVADPYHLWRVHRDFELLGFTAYPSPALNCRRNRAPLLRIEYALREAILLVRDIALYR